MRVRCFQIIKSLVSRAHARRTLAALVIGFALFHAASVEVQASDPDLSELKARVEALERQNAELRQTVLQRLPDTNESSETFVNAGVLNLNNSTELYSAFDAYLAEKEARKEAADEAARGAGYEVGTELGMTATWKDGLELSTKNRDFRVHVGGRTQVDVGWFDADPNLYTAGGLPTGTLGNVYADGADFRRARLRVDGTMYEQIEWAAEYDLENSAVLGGTARALTAPTDLWFSFNEIPFLGTVKIGNQKEAMGFEHIVSSRFLPFMERSYNQDTFYGGVFNGFIPGIAALGTYGEDDIGTYNIGIFKPTNNVFAFNTGDGDYALTGRLTRLLWWEEEGRQLVHVGLSLRQATAVGTAVGAASTTPLRQHQFRTRDAIRTGLSANWPTPANINLFGDDEQTANAEFVVTNGRFTFQSEYLVNGLQDARRLGGDPLGTTAVYHGGYAQALFFLTDDHDHYGKKLGAFERVRPKENFFLVRDERGCRCFGSGAWQVGARYNYLDLNDAGLNGGILHNATAGVNWFLNPNMKIQFNYMATYRDAPTFLAPNADRGDGWIHGWGFRLAHDF